jgi:uncharacterized RDD family membrane protein YckC
MNGARPLAGRGRRLAATVIDMILVPAVALLLVMATGAVEDPEDYRDFAFVLPVLGLAVLAYLLLNGWLLYARGQTVGKWLLGIGIVNHASGERAPLWRLVLIRAPFFPLLFLLIANVLALLPLADVLPVFMKSRRCVHDLVAGTAVVKV